MKNKGKIFGYKVEVYYHYMDLNPRLNLTRINKKKDSLIRKVFSRCFGRGSILNTKENYSVIVARHDANSIQIMEKDPIMTLSIFARQFPEGSVFEKAIIDAKKVFIENKASLGYSEYVNTQLVLKNETSTDI